MDLALTLPAGPGLNVEDQAEAVRRFTIIEPLITPAKFVGVWAQCGGRKMALVELLARKYGVATRTLHYWLKAYKGSGMQGLVNRDRSDKGRPRALNGAALDFLAAAALPKKGGYGSLTVREIYRAYQEEAAWRESHAGKPLGEFEAQKYARYLNERGQLSPASMLPAVSAETMRTWFLRIPELVRVLAREGLEAYSNTQELLSFRELASLEPLDYVVLDHRCLDLFCLVPERGGWKLLRPWCTAALDMATRRWLASVIVEVPSSTSIATVLKKVFLKFGLPAGIYVDNGMDFRCEYLEGNQVRSRQASRIGELAPQWRGVLDALGVRISHSIVRRARSKIIEPNFRRTAEYDRSTPWYCGHKPTARPERFAALLDQHQAWLRGTAPPAFPTISGIAALYSEALEMFNGRDLPGEGMQAVRPTGLGFMSPNEAWGKKIGQIPKRIVDPATLQFCFNKRRAVTVRNGEAPTVFLGQRFHYRLIDNPQGLMALNGKSIEFAFDPLDLEIVAIYWESRFLGLAANAELRKMGESGFVADERIRRRARREVSRAIEAAHQVWVPGVVERAARRAEVRPACIEPPRVEVPAELPVEVLAAARAVEEHRRFRFADVNGAAAQACPGLGSGDDGTLKFWGDK